MKQRAARYARPALWGFFICMTLALILAIARFYTPGFINKHWSAKDQTSYSHAEATIKDNFQKRIDRLTLLVDYVSADPLFGSIGSRIDEYAVLKLFNDLNSYKLNDDQTLEVIDSTGKVIAWNGPSISSKYSDIMENNRLDRFVYVSRNGLRTYLSVGARISGINLYLMASEPLELNSPISNRFIRKVSINEELSKELKTQVVLRVPPAYIPHDGEILVPISDKEGRVIAGFTVTEEATEGEIQSIVDAFKTLIVFCIALGSVLVVLSVIFRVTRKQNSWLSLAVNIMALWFIRLVWCRIKFPGEIIGGTLFSPNLYASPSLYGLISSFGDLIITVLTLLISSWMLFSFFKRDTIDDISNQIGSRSGRSGIVLVVSIFILLLLWLFRGFNEAVRSFIFDSTVQYDNPSEIFMTGNALAMQIVILLLGVSLLCVSIILIRIGISIVKRYFKSKLSYRIALLAIISVCMVLFVLLDQTRPESAVTSIIFILSSIIVAELITKWENDGLDYLSQRQRTIISMILVSFVIGVPVLHQKSIIKERKEVEVMAKELLRPSDSWLNYIVLESLHTASYRLRNEYEKTESDLIKEKKIAFILWAETLLGKEGYNSALLFYDNDGNEVDRFVVGINRYELREILQRMFDGEENAVHVSEQYKTKMLIKSYGAWITVQGSQGNIIGSIALLLSEQQKSFYYEKENDLLQQYSNRLETSDNREIAVHELRNDKLVFSSGRKLHPAQDVFRDASIELQGEKNVVLWKELKINDYGTQTVFVRNASSPEVTMAVSIEELDIRWDVFSYLKILFVYLTFIAIITVSGFVWRLLNKQKPSIGFRGKLFLGFACITFLSLLILSYYNRQLVAERVHEQLENTLSRQLFQLQERIIANALDEEDFINGINDDYCEALTSEYGIDFSVYRDGIVKASSRPELYRAALLNERLNGSAYTAIILDGKSYTMVKERTGSIEYVVGYAPLILDGKVAGIISVPTINRQKEIEDELAQRNAYVFGAYAIVFGIALAGGGLLTLRFAGPLRQLTLAAKEVSNGNMDVGVVVKSRDEIGTLTKTFNEMIVKIRESRIELAKHEREIAWKEMAKQIAHEIRNPLTPIKLSIQHLRQAFKDRAPEREEILNRVTQTVIDQIETLSRISSEFSKFAKMPEGKYERVHIDELLRETMNLFREIPGVEFLDKLSAPSVIIVADRDQLRGVFINIVRNAIQAMNKDVKIKIETFLSDGIIIIKISDTGMGIPDDIKAKIFEPNFSTKTEGMGLGLAIARRVIENSGGNISCSSSTAKGTTFEIHLPA